MNQTNEDLTQDPLVVHKDEEKKSEQQESKQFTPEQMAALKNVDGFTDEIFSLLIKEMQMELGLLVNRNI